MPRTRLHAVKPGDAPQRPPDKKATVSEAAASGDRRLLLVALRDRIAKAVQDPDCPPKDLSPLTRQLAAIAKEIEGIDLAEKQEAERGAEVADEAFDASAI